MKITAKATGMMGIYDLYHDGIKVGRVAKIEQRYNITRPVTVTYWRLDLNGQPDDGIHYRTRRDAFAAVESA